MACTIRQMCDFAGWPVLGWLSPGGIPCLGPVFRRGYRVRAKSSSFSTPAVIDVHITPDVGAISSAPRAPVANRAHRRNHLSRSATGRSRGAITRLDVGMGLFGEHARSISELFWSDGGRMRGRARDRLAWSRPDRAPRLALLLWRSRGKVSAVPERCPSIRVHYSPPRTQPGLSSVTAPASAVVMTSVACSLKANNISSCAATKNRSESRRRG